MPRGPELETPRFALAVDAGGTFTGTAVIEAAGRVSSAKAPTTLVDPTQGVIASLSNTARGLGLKTRGLLEASERLHLASTVATNSLLTHRGPRRAISQRWAWKTTLGLGACSHLPGMASGKLRMIDEITSF